MIGGEAKGALFDIIFKMPNVYIFLFCTHLLRLLHACVWILACIVTGSYITIF